MSKKYGKSSVWDRWSRFLRHYRTTRLVPDGFQYRPFIVYVSRFSLPKTSARKTNVDRTNRYGLFITDCGKTISSNVISWRHRGFRYNRCVLGTYEIRNKQFFLVYWHGNPALMPSQISSNTSIDLDFTRIGNGRFEKCKLLRNPEKHAIVDDERTWNDRVILLWCVRNGNH